MAEKNIKYLRNYLPPNYLVDKIDLTFQINEDNSVLATTKTCYYKNQNTNINSLILDGTAKLIAICLDNETLSTKDYIKNEDQLQINNLPDSFTLEVTTELQPYANKSYMGLFESQGTLVTQCEPEGFRKITYFPDHPDVLAKFSTTIIANKDKYPVLLSNGNKIFEETTDNGQKTVKWEDPFRKPCYLFALCAGDFDVLKDSFVTKSGKTVALEIYTQSKHIKRSFHAMESLKRAMRWDETRFGLEYDLNTYMIVASSNFNMGAMENKGLNVFNTKYILADSETATDNDFITVEGVIGHEYFHNWTGNRVTCRDWFQLSLKEGLTVFRDHEFTADMHSRSVQRINNVIRLRQAQFVEDSSPLAHPVRPSSYLEINNFYTTTVYDKGSEVVRMYQTILGRDGFNKGLTLYIKRHDGTAATCEDFYAAMVDANNIDLNGFMLWYSQDGTPNVKVTTNYDINSAEFSLTFEQTIPDTLQQKNKQAMLIPIKIGLFYPDGKEITSLNPVSGRYIANTDGLILLLTEKTNTFTFKNIKAQPIPSLLREFSAPIKLEFDYTNHELLFLVNNDSDEFNRYQCLKEIVQHRIQNIYNSLINKNALSEIDSEVWQSMRNILTDPNLDAEFKSLMFQLPSFSEILATMTNVNPNVLAIAITHFGQQLGEQLFDNWMEIYNLNLTKTYKFTDHGSRALKNTALFYILKALSNKLSNPSSLQLVETMTLGQYHNSDNMTDSIAALIAVNDLDTSVRHDILQEFYNKWQDNELVMDKWFSLQALTPLVNVNKLNQLIVDPAFIATNPNKIYALLRNFTQNMFKFHHEDSYEFIADQIINIDKFNPHVASTIARGFSSGVYLSANYRAMAKNALGRILKQDSLSNSTYEITNQILAGLNI